MTTSLTLDTGEVLDMSAYPLPDGYGDEVFNREQLAKAMNTSTVTISKWVDLGMPVAQRGGNGQSYEFRFSHCYAWRLWREGRDADERRARDGRASQLAMLFLGQEEEQADHRLTPKEVKEWSEAELIRNRASEQRGELVRAAQMQDVLDRVLVSFRNAVMNMPDWLEQEFSLSPQQVDKAQKFCDGILSEARLQVSDAGFHAPEVVALDQRQGG
ncbi:terminase small subunit [Thalassovita sp.]|uniref:terminase small subunit n=1 Tax=Thalassovita sp. TaxID=1979401 RepID=UPI0028814D71|nr:terminase small subunit [Thalassovita sp.]MDF1801716.1 terminase small subunit [Thalassovita sp.]